MKLERHEKVRLLKSKEAKVVYAVTGLVSMGCVIGAGLMHLLGCAECEAGSVDYLSSPSQTPGASEAGSCLGPTAIQATIDAAVKATREAEGTAICFPTPEEVPPSWTPTLTATGEIKWTRTPRASRTPRPTSTKKVVVPTNPHGGTATPGNPFP